jgi:hypothetical protein
MGPVLQNIPDGHVFDHLEFHAWPPYPAEGVFVDDDGVSTAYQKGESAQTNVRAEQNGNKLVMVIAAAQGSFSGQPEKRRVDVFLHRAGEVESARVNGENAPVVSNPAFVRISFEHTVKQVALIEVFFRA